MKEKIVYQIFVRNYSKEGTFKAVKNDLKRIKFLGVDIIYLMPIHEIGILNRKGTYGSPYAIKDYFSITKDYGDLNDFRELVNEAHHLKMKIILDMVFNHTSPDNVLIDSHPEYYFYKNGKRGNRVGDWSDIVDLDNSKIETRKYLISVLKYWLKQGVDGFRFDVASMIPLTFFKEAREQLGQDIIFIAESVDVDFYHHLKDNNEDVIADKDLNQVFDAAYNYYWYKSLEKYLKGNASIDEFIHYFNEDNLVNKIDRMNCLENHDIDRIASYVDNDRLTHLVDFISSLKGLMFLYAGQEYGAKHKPELFEKDPINLTPNKQIEEIYLDAIKRKKNQKPIDYQLLEKVNENTVKLNTYYLDKAISSKIFKL